MDFIQNHISLHFFFIFFFIFLSLPLCHSSSIHGLLKSMGLPPGLFPKEVRSYNFSGSGLLQVFLDGPCLTKFDTLALYESELRANLSHGSLTGVEGLSQEELFLWLPVKDIIVDDPSSGLILLDIGVAHKQLSLSVFEDPPDCTSKSALKESTRKQKKKKKKKKGFVAEKIKGSRENATLMPS